MLDGGGFLPLGVFIASQLSRDLGLLLWKLFDARFWKLHVEVLAEVWCRLRNFRWRNVFLGLVW